MRAKFSVPRKTRKRKIMDAAKGYRGTHSRSYKIAKEAVQHSLQYSFRDRKNRKRDFRRLWIIRINAAANNNGISYSKFICGLKKANLEINRKVLSDLALQNPEAFTKLVELAKSSLAN
ncbi:MAG: 50S ribosomal protein L20 [bacterium]|nr:50S ribosomal protein L20 [bacterium]